MGNRESEQEPLTASAAVEANMCCIIFSVTVAAEQGLPFVACRSGFGRVGLRLPCKLGRL